MSNLCCSPGKLTETVHRKLKSNRIKKEAMQTALVAKACLRRV